MEKIKEFLTSSGIPDPKKSLFWLRVLTEKGHEKELIRKVINVLKCENQNPITRRAFEMLTGKKLPKTQKESQTFLERFTEIEPQSKKWLTELEVKELAEKYAREKVVIDDNKSDWKKGRKMYILNPCLNQIVGIEDGHTLVYSRNGYEFSRPLSAIRDFVIGGKSMIGDAKNEEYAKSLFTN